MSCLGRKDELQASWIFVSLKTSNPSCCSSEVFSPLFTFRSLQMKALSWLRLPKSLFITETLVNSEVLNQPSSQVVESLFDFAVDCPRNLTAVLFSCGL